MKRIASWRRALNRFEDRAISADIGSGQTRPNDFVKIQWIDKPTQMDLEPGAKLGPYEILSPIGAGGMGKIYTARDSRLDRIEAIKVAHEEFSPRFEQEGRAAAALNHPNICTLHDVRPNYLVMEYLEGDTLAARIANGPLAIDGALSMAIQIAVCV